MYAKKNKALENALGLIERNYGSGSIMRLGDNKSVDIEAISTGSLGLDIALGISIFIIVIFFILLINKGISKAVKYTGLGNLDTIFGFFFGFVRSYIIAVSIFSAVHIVYLSLIHI